MFGLIGMAVVLVIGILIGWSIPQPEWAKGALKWIGDKIIAAARWIQNKIDK